MYKLFTTKEWREFYDGLYFLLCENNRDERLWLILKMSHVIWLKIEYFPAKRKSTGTPHMRRVNGECNQTAPVCGLLNVLLLFCVLTKILILKYLTKKNVSVYFVMNVPIYTFLYTEYCNLNIIYSHFYIINARGSIYCGLNWVIQCATRYTHA